MFLTLWYKKLKNPSSLIISTSTPLKKYLKKKDPYGNKPFFIPDQVMGRPFVVLTFEFVDLCYHSNETSLVEVLHSTVKAR